MKIFLFIIAILIYSDTSLKSQVSIQGKLYPDLLWGEGEEYPNDFALGGFTYHKDDFILTTGKLWQGNPPPSRGSFTFEGEEIRNSGEFNNQAVNLLLTFKSEDRIKAREMFQSGIKFDPRFFPFRYNYARLLEIEKEYEESIRQFEFAKNEIPDYFRTYIHIGILSEWTNETIYAIQNYKKAASLNQWDTQGLVLLAEHYMNTGLNNRAKQYLDKALSIEEGSPNARLGLARLEFQSGNFHKAYMIFSKTELFSPEGKEKNYDKKLHYYYAETASRVQDYETAEAEYSKILEYPNDPFFANFPFKVVERRRNIAKKFSDIKKSSLENADLDSQ
jgi:tetratricopeptide (TPR) repeat protein